MKKKLIEQKEVCTCKLIETPKMKNLKTITVEGFPMWFCFTHNKFIIDKQTVKATSDNHIT